MNSNTNRRLRRACKQCATVLPVVRRNEDPHEVFPHYKHDDEVKVFVSWSEDPFAADIHEDYTLMWLCNACYYVSGMEI